MYTSNIEIMENVYTYCIASHKFHHMLKKKHAQVHTSRSIIINTCPSEHFLLKEVLYILTMADFLLKHC